jgi:hypothetical protein
VTSGVSQPIDLSAIGLSDGACASFTPSTISAGDTATMTISPSISTAAGTMPLTVVGTGTSAIHNTSVSLTVNAPTVIRSAFYYPWFPDAWSQHGLSPFSSFVPTRGYYSTDVATVSAQIADLQYARSHVQSVLTKLGAHSRFAAVRVAVRHSMVDPRTGDWLVPGRQVNQRTP